MTSERKWIVGFEDIKAIALECNSCKVRMIHSPEDIRVPNSCPSCNSDWLPVVDGGSGRMLPARTRVIAAIREIRDLASKAQIDPPSRPIPGFRVLMEFEEP
jgi:hypothetical protein